MHKSATITLALLISFAGFSQLRAQDSVVRKTAKEANPTLLLAAFQGEPAIRSRFTKLLIACDWFTVVNSGEAAYSLSIDYQKGTTESIRLSISDRSGANFVLQKTAPIGMTDALLSTTVDALLQKLFGVPGICMSKIAFAVGGHAAMKEVYITGFDGTGARRLTHNGSISTEPSWGPGGRTMVYTVYENNATSVIMVDTVHSRQRRLSRFPGLNAGADLSPDGRWAALSLSRDRRIELYLLSTASGRLHRLTQDMAVESSPCWSPNGAQLCYVSDKAGKPHLYVMPARGGASSRLLRTWDETVSPDWSAVSNQICFSTRIGGQYVIGIVDMKDPARERRILTKIAGDWEAPSWAPDGRHLVCSRKLSGKRALYMVDTWHGKTIQITQGGDHSLPSWSDLLE